ncbi:uncharacterized protein [Pseudorasbora parva]|uniref:uncharacterized protein n=1 Tax=Pseudorasbora parva TaxID=51549 RepID=UPI00351DCD81
MGQTYPKPEPSEAPKAWMERCSWGYYTNPYLDNLAGWTEGTQWRSYPREGTFDPGFLRNAFDLIYGKQGDPNWDYDYMKEGYDVWYKMADVWRDKTRAYVPKAVLKTVPNPEKLKKNSPKKNKPTTAVPEHCTLPRENPPPYVSPSNLACVSKTSPPPAPLQVSEKPCENKKEQKIREIPKIYPSLPTSEGINLDNSECDDNEYADMQDLIKGPKVQNVAAVWMEKRGGIDIQPPSPSALKDIIDLLPSPSKPIQFVDMLIRTSRHCQLVGADYRFILQCKLGDAYNEEALIAAVAVLEPGTDRIETVKEEVKDETRKTKKTVITLKWRDQAPEMLKELEKNLKKYLLNLKAANRDLSQVTNCKQEKDEPPSQFMKRFIDVWMNVGGLDLDVNKEHPMFLSTFMANCTPAHQDTLKHHLSDRSTLKIKDAAAKIRTLESDGLFQTQGVKKNVACVAVQSQNQGQNSGRKKGKCDYCQKPGHWYRECRKRISDRQNLKVGRRPLSVPMYGAGPGFQGPQHYEQARQGNYNPQRSTGPADALPPQNTGRGGPNPYYHH